MWNRVPVVLLVICAVLGPAYSQNGNGYLPNPRLTPGDAFEVTRDDVCSSSYSNPDEQVPIELKRRVFERYGISSRSDGYNVDHLIPTSLGGSNSIKNLWPQPLSGEWNHQMKNRLEHHLLKLVCNGTISLETARSDVATNWVEAYKKYLRPPHKNRKPAGKPR